MNYIYLDGAEERKQLIENMRQIRRDMLATIEAMPEDQWYEARYHGWSLAAILGYLNLMDNLFLILINLALLGFRFPIPPPLLDIFDKFMAGLFRRRLMTASIQGMHANEQRLADYIGKLPVDQFTRQVYLVQTQQYTTVERGIQYYFLHRWQERLRTIRAVEVLQQEPPEGSDSIEE